MQKRLLVLIASLSLGACGGGGIPIPNPTPEPTPTPEPCLPEVPWCGDVGQTCSSVDSPCKHNPTSDPNHCELAPDCPTEPIPEPPEPTPEPPPSTGECKLGTLPATQVAQATIKVQKSGAKNVSGTPFGRFGKEYYCSAEMNWPEACASGKIQGPVAPDGHPQRLACEKVFLGQNCPTFSMAQCTGTGAQCPITFDPFYVQGGVNQNHPANVAAGCGGQFTDDPSWVKDNDGHIISGQFWMSMPSGKGYIKACDSTGTVCGVSNYEIDQ